MSYFKNNLYQYFIFIVRFRVLVIAFFSLIFFYLAFTMTSMLTHNDDELWLQGSKEYNKLLDSNHKPVYVQKLQLHVGKKAFSSKNIDNMKLLHANLKTLKEVVKNQLSINAYRHLFF